jgi:ADP-ribose pyrophosphatase
MKKEQIFAGRIFSLALEEHLLPDGRTDLFEMVRHPGGAAVLPVLADGRIVLLRQYRPAISRWLWEVPAGRLNIGEDPEACARRELREETGWIAGRLHRLGEMLTTPGFCDELIFLYLASELLSGPASPEPDEHLQVVELTIQQGIALLEGGEIIDAKTQLAILLYMNKHRQ